MDSVLYNSELSFTLILLVRCYFLFFLQSSVLIPGVGKLYDLFDVSISDPQIKKFFLDVISEAMRRRDNGEVKVRPHTTYIICIVDR